MMITTTNTTITNKHIITVINLSSLITLLTKFNIVPERVLYFNLLKWINITIFIIVITIQINIVSVSVAETHRARQ